jgi:hypothetical protein
MKDLGRMYRWGVSIALALLLAWLMVDLAQGQSFGEATFRAEGTGGVMAWASDSHSYQHTMNARGDFAATWEPLIVRIKLGLTRWGASDAIIDHTLLNAETGKVYSRRQGVSLGVRWNGVELGVEYDRRSVHHVWRNKKRRHDHFPGSWRVGRSGDAPDWNQNPIYPSLGYWGGVRPYFRVERGGLTVACRGLLYHWKSLTLPWPAVRMAVGYRWGRWRVGVDVQGFRHRDLTGTVRVELHVVGPVWLRGSGGWAHPPQWRDQRLRRLAFGLILKTE